MIGKSFALILLLSVISTIKCELNATKILNGMCKVQLKDIYDGIFEKLLKEREDCRVSFNLIQFIFKTTNQNCLMIGKSCS